jgi:hypothetical protein
MNPWKPAVRTTGFVVCLFFALFVLPLQTKAASAGGSVFLSNLNYLDNSGSSSSLIPFGRDINGVVPIMAQEFHTGSNPNAYLLNTVTLAFDNAIGAPGDFTLKVYDSAAGAPNHSLRLLSGSSNPSVHGNYAYTASGLTLQPDSDYFLVLQGNGPTFPSGNNQFMWYSTTGGPGDSNDGWQVEPIWYSFASGGSSAWTQWAGHAPGAFQIDASVVPEPSAGALLLAGCALVLLHSHPVIKRARAGRVGVTE